MPVDANPSRPHIPGYGVPETNDGLLPWDYVAARMERSRNYWIITMEGSVGFAERGSDPVLVQVQDAYETKYGMRHPPPFWALEPKLVLAWSDLGRDATRWIFESRAS